MFYRPFYRSMGVWIINEFLKEYFPTYVEDDYIASCDGFIFFKDNIILKVIEFLCCQVVKQMLVHKIKKCLQK